MIDPKKEYKTRDGRKVRILATDLRKKFSVVAAISNRAEADEDLFIYYSNGRRNISEDSPLDLIEVKPVFTRWIAITERSGYPTKEAAQRAYKHHSVAAAVVPINFSLGDGFEETENLEGY